MNIESFRDFCLSKKGVTEEFPFDELTLVFKVMGKMFALTGVDNFRSINLKCDPEWAIDLREKYHAILPGYHMNKKHWNTVVIDGTVSDPFLEELILHSYKLVVEKLPKTLRSELENYEEL
jgi:predicted DNA-binding protein (MmcQ/YjbR family)